MTRLHKKIHSHLHTKKNPYLSAAIALSVLLVVGTFFITRGSVPAMSELAFMESSVNAVGYVMPASDESLPPTGGTPPPPPPPEGDTTGGTPPPPPPPPEPTCEELGTCPPPPPPEPDPDQWIIDLFWGWQFWGSNDTPAPAPSTPAPSSPAPSSPEPEPDYGGWEPSSTPSGCGPGTLNDLCPTPAIRNQAVNFPNITFICDNSDSYTVVHNETGTTVGQGPTSSGATVSVQFSAEGNYTLTCKSGPLTASAVVNYTAPVLTLSGMSLSANPRTVNNNKNTTLSWSIVSPSGACSLRAEAVCSGGRTNCSEAQLSNEQSLNTTLTNGTTDANDQYGANRNIQTAVKTIYGQYSNRAAGKKTLPMSYTTDFVLDCGAGLIKKMRVIVSDEYEG